MNLNNLKKLSGDASFRSFYRKKSNKQTELISGPYYAINFMKNDYILLKQFGFEELDIINE